MTRAVHLTPLTPLAFLGRAADVFADHTAVVHGARRESYAELAAHTTRLARALQSSGIGPGDRVAYLCPNIPELLVAHFAVPLARAVLVAINTRLAAQEVATILDHSGARIVVVDTELAHLVSSIADGRPTIEEVVLVDDAGVNAELPGTAYPDLLARGSDEPMDWSVDDEDAISTRSARTSPRGTTTARCTCGPCRCSTATAGATHGRSRRSAAPR